jgi:hypothetical protein
MSFPAWEPAVVPVRTGRGTHESAFSLQPRRPDKKFQGNMKQKTVLHPMPKKKGLSVLQLDLYLLSCLATSGCPSRNWDTGLRNQRFFFQPRRSKRKFQGIVTQKNCSTSYVQVLQHTNMVLLYFHFFPNHRLFPFLLWVVGRGGFLHFDMPKSNTN